MIDVKNQLFLIPELSGDSLVISGKGKLKLLILATVEQVGEAETDMLKRMMNAIQLDMEEDTWFCQLQKDKRYSISGIMPDFNDIFIFGLMPENIGFHIEYRKNELVQFEQKRLLVCDSLHTLNTSPEHKRPLWAALQSVYPTRK